MNLLRETQNSPLPMESSTCSTPLLSESKNIAPLRLTSRSAFSFRRLDWSNLDSVLKVSRLLAILVTLSTLNLLSKFECKYLCGKKMFPQPNTVGTKLSLHCAKG